MNRGYQFNFSDSAAGVFDEENRLRKAKTTYLILKDYWGKELSSCRVLNVGGSSGIIDKYLADFVASIVCIDIDEKAISYAQQHQQADNLTFKVGDAMSLDFEDGSFDIVICSHVYEHVPDASIMMDEIHRVLRGGGTCYFGAGNRIMWNEPHYNLPLLAVMPRFLANSYMRISNRGSEYYEKHLTYWGLKTLGCAFKTVDYTGHLIKSSEEFSTDYMVKPGSLKQKIAAFIYQYFRWLVPGYVWILVKPGA